MNRKNKGFTLVEILVVVIIIGVLAAIAIPKYQKAVDKADFMCVMSVLKTLTDAQQMAALSHGSYPSPPNYFKFGDLDVSIPGINSSCANSDMCQSFKCGQKSFNIVLRNNQTWGNFSFWGATERIYYTSGSKTPYQLRCSSTRCKKIAKSFGGEITKATEDVEFYSW